MEVPLRGRLDLDRRWIREVEENDRVSHPHVSVPAIEGRLNLMAPEKSA